MRMKTLYLIDILQHRLRRPYRTITISISREKNRIVRILASRDWLDKRRQVKHVHLPPQLTSVVCKSSLENYKSGNWRQLLLSHHLHLFPIFYPDMPADFPA